MELYNLVIKGVQELFYFDIWESLLMIIAFTIFMRIKISKYQILFHSFMLSVLDYLIINLINIPILQQFISIVLCCLYFTIVFRTNIKETIIKTLIIFFGFFIIEMLAGMIYQYVFKIQMMSLANNFVKFIYFIPLRGTEFILLYIIYFKEGRK